uniref:interleukin-17 receptor E isoform X2 n=1 Tax=Monopterus albus TaxID=43700 RepID=UPI0009B46E4F|nr:interleukin-17 receptor E isoform X2 [Monopterus albus]
MFKMRLGTALLFLTAVVSPLLLECTPTCQMENLNGHVEGGCSVKLTPGPVQLPNTSHSYSQCVTVRVWMTTDDLCRGPKIEIHSSFVEIFSPTMNKKKKCSKRNLHTRVKCVAQQSTHGNTSVTMWVFMHKCVKAEAGSTVSVTYSTASTSCSDSYTVRDPVPDFNLSVTPLSKNITVTVEPGYKVYARWCYNTNGAICFGGLGGPRCLYTIDPSQSQSAHLSIPFLLPCLCVEVFYTYRDARRNKKCPFQDERLADVADVWLSSNVTLYDSSVIWHSLCPASDLKISASLCWRQHEQLCTPVLNSTLKGQEDGTSLIYNTSTVDKHPQMCVQFFHQGRYNISCPFEADMSSWEVAITLGRQSVFVSLSSSVPAMFSAQLCVLNEMGCAPTGPVSTLTVEGSMTEARINVLPHHLVLKPCVQVWQSDPAFHGRRILCPDYTRNRCGLYTVVALIFVIIIALLGRFIHQLTQSGAAGWLYIQKPVLLVCSSEQSAHVSAVCTLASILQEELSATVHLALWAQSSQRQAAAETGTAVADLGPLPWLYGQWEVVRKAQGKVLIIWSPEAKKTYEKQREERSNKDKKDSNKADVRHVKIRVCVEEDYKLDRKRLVKCKKEKVTGTDCIKLYDDENRYPQKAPSAVITPVFAAALCCLEGSLQQCKGQGVAVVYFQGLGHSRDIPKALRGIPRYCLPQDFRGLIQELGGMRRQATTGKARWHCWPRLLTKVLSIWLARRLAYRLQTLLPQNAGAVTSENDIS